MPISFTSLIRIKCFLHFGGLHNDQNHPIRPKPLHVQVMYNIQLEQCDMAIHMAKYIRLNNIFP